jgi:hypothetical protein
MRWSNCDGHICGENQHIYDIHPGDKVYQEGRHGWLYAGGYSESITSMSTATVKYLEYGNHTGCPSGVQGRTSVVNYECGGSTLDENVVTNVMEHNTCEYTFTVASRACCTSAPTRVPTADPTPHPTDEPSRSPSSMPTKLPTHAPTAVPTSVPTFDDIPNSCAQDPVNFAGLQLVSPVMHTTLTIGSHVTMQGGVLNCGRLASSGVTDYVTTQMYTAGDIGLTCATVGIPYGHRETMVQYRCGPRREIISVGEPASCSFILQVQMPNCCTVEESNALNLDVTNQPTVTPSQQPTSLSPSQHPTNGDQWVQVIELKHRTDNVDDKWIWSSLAVVFVFLIISMCVFRVWGANSGK